MQWFSRVGVVVLGGVVAGGAWAQVVSPPTPGRIDQSIPEVGKKEPPPTVKTIPSAATAQGIERLGAVQLQSPWFAEEVKSYWEPFMGKAVSAQELANFRAWLFDRLRDEGYLASVDTNETPLAGGATALNIVVTQSLIGTVRVVTLDTKLDQNYVDEVVRRFATEFKSGQPVDVRAMDANLAAIAFDLPLNLEINIKPQSGQLVEVEVSLTPLPSQPGKFLGGVAQLNNYGVPSFGQNQALTSLRFEGLAPTSEASLSGLVSHGVRYGKAQYDTPVTGTKTRVHVWASNLHAHSENVVFETKEWGLGATRLVGVDRAGTSKLGVDWVLRQNPKTLADILVAQPVDRQWRLRWQYESTASMTDSLNNEVIVSSGATDLSADTADQLADDQTAQTGRRYEKLEIIGAYKHGWGADKTYSSAVRWRAQIANHNLHSLNQFSLGGMDGVRAYNAAEGTGDSGVTLSLDTGRYLMPEERLYAGVFYDVGYAVARVNPSAATPATGYQPLIQGAGVRLAGKVSRWAWNAALAKSFGQAPDYTPSNITTPVGEWRARLDVSYNF